MTITVSWTAWKELWGENWRKAANLYEPGVTDIITEYPQQFADGYRRFIGLRNGIVLEINNFECRKDFAYEVEPHKHSCLEFVFSISRNSRRNDGQHLVSGQNYLTPGGFYPRGWWVNPEGQRCLEVNIYIQFDMAKAYFHGQMELSLFFHFPE